MQEKRYTIRELQSLTNTNRRTIHFYSQKGLIPPPDSRGGGATYPEDALTRLQIIKKLQERRLTLDEIKNALDSDYEGLKDLLKETKSVFNKVKSKEELSDYLMSNYGRIARRSTLFEPEFDLCAKIMPEAFSLPFKEQMVRRIHLAEGIELSIKDEIYRKHREVIKKGISEFKRLLSREGIDK